MSKFHLADLSFEYLQFFKVPGAGMPFRPQSKIQGNNKQIQGKIAQGQNTIKPLQREKATFDGKPEPEAKKGLGLGTGGAPCCGHDERSTKLPGNIFGKQK